MFIPAFEYHRFLKVGLGGGVFYTDISYKLHLCSQYQATPETNDVGEVFGWNFSCIGKTEIDSTEAKVLGLSYVGQLTLWERVTKDSVWVILRTSWGDSMFPPMDTALKLKNHDKNLDVHLRSQTREVISYTYRF